MNELIADSSFLYALYNAKERQHGRTRTFSESTTFRPLIPDVVLPEVAFLFHRRGGVPAVAAFLHSLVASGIELTPISLSDIERAQMIMVSYASADLDFVDCVIMALAERMNITRIATFDRRDFSLVRPKHCDYYELLP